MRGPQATDAELVARVFRGDRDALSALHDRHYPRLYRLAYLKLNDPDDAHDIASEVFVRAVRDIRGLHPLRTESLYPWLHTVTCNLITDRLRRKPRRDHLSLDDTTRSEVAALIEQTPNGRPLPDQVLERKEVQAYVRALLNELPEAQATAVLYRFVGEMSISEIARAMDRSEGAVKSLLHRAICNLREALAAGRRPGSQILGGDTDVGRDSIRVHR